MKAVAAPLRSLALCALFALICTGTGASADAQPGGTLYVRGVVLVVESGYLVFTTGDAVRLGAGVTAPSASLGKIVRVAVDARSHAVTAIELDPTQPEPGEIDAAALPREYVAVDPRSAQSAPGGRAEGGQPGSVTVAIEVRVPDDTPPNDDVYLATDRTGFNAAELKLNRVDAHRWTVSLQLPAGSTLHYVFTRGSYATVERTHGGGIEQPRVLSALSNAAVDDDVARWADTT